MHVIWSFKNSLNQIKVSRHFLKYLLYLLSHDLSVILHLFRHRQLAEFYKLSFYHFIYLTFKIKVKGCLIFLEFEESSRILPVTNVVSNGIVPNIEVPNDGKCLCVCMCLRACVRACIRACVHLCVCYKHIILNIIYWCHLFD
jgi:hypothetical protein